MCEDEEVEEKEKRVNTCLDWLVNPAKRKKEGKTRRQSEHNTTHFTLGYEMFQDKEYPFSTTNTRWLSKSIKKSKTEKKGIHSLFCKSSPWFKLLI